jgi:hypothetical protein
VAEKELKITFYDEEVVHKMVLTLALLPPGPKEVSLVEQQ